eukprot:CAMPEP_0115033102 /NCGR_PEP_ID=MMETSP0216-20121206/39617_1 /TAXON_ID=223996 /ORGANISM="Protocruzia adherens, Strain Boccale" /LENGTH=132 /DNA_ID=CAMNT_0002411255 /DNA_START=161 /DNA_END=559 /DNA_ORIENTATION=-
MGKIKPGNDISIIFVNGEATFFQQKDGPLLPTLRLLHKYPFMCPHMQVDKGAIKFMLTGANPMCPGFTSPGGRMDEVEEDQVVAIMCEGMEHAVAIGITTLSTEQIKAVNKGKAVENCHYLGDRFWTKEILG